MTIRTLGISVAAILAGVAVAAFAAIGSGAQASDRRLDNIEAAASPTRSLTHPWTFAQLDENLELHLSREWDPVAGGEIYDETCVACHGEDGAGAVPGAPDFTLQDGVLAQADDVLMNHIEDGFKSPGSMLEMPAKGGDDTLEMDDIMNVLSYLHRKFHYHMEF